MNLNEYFSKDSIEMIKTIVSIIGLLKTGRSILVSESKTNKTTKQIADRKAIISNIIFIVSLILFGLVIPVWSIFSNIGRSGWLPWLWIVLSFMVMCWAVLLAGFIIYTNVLLSKVDFKKLYNIKEPTAEEILLKQNETLYTVIKENEELIRKLNKE